MSEVESFAIECAFICSSTCLLLLIAIASLIVSSRREKKDINKKERWLEDYRRWSCENCIGKVAK